MNSTEELQVDAASGGPVSRLRGRFAVGLDRIAAFVEANPWVGFAAILALYLVYLRTHATLRLPWHDELFTYYIAQAPTFGQMIRLTQSVDLNPPLYYILARFAFHFFHPDSFSLRLPSMIAFLLAAYCLYLFVGRRLSRIYGFLAALLLLGSEYKSYAFEARPYALVLGCLGIAAIGWQLATEHEGRRRRLGLLLLLLGGFAMLLSHVLALIAYGAFFFAELVRLAIRRKPDWLLWIVLLLPLSSTILYRPLFQNHGATGVSFPSPFQASLLRLLLAYETVWLGLGQLLAAAVIAILLFQGPLQTLGARRSSGKSRSSFSLAEGAFAIYLVFVPVIITVLFMRSHSAYFDRYGMVDIFGACILVPWLIAGWTGVSRRAGLLAAFVFAFGIVPPVAFVTYGQKWIQPPQAQGPDLTGISAVALTDVQPELPFVDASGLTFLEMDSRENSAFLSRVYYLTDPQAALQYSHASIFDGFGALKHIFPIRANVVPYGEFIGQHHKFLVYGTFDYPEDWLLRKLLTDGATARYIGDFPRGYKDSTLYEITLPQR